MSPRSNAFVNAATRDRMPTLSISTIPNGVELPALCGKRDWMPKSILRLLYLGRLDPIKGIENLIRAIAVNQSEVLTLRICGTGEASYVEYLRGLAHNLGLQDRITFVGAVESDRKYLEFQSADACIVPSYSESFGMVVAESLAHGVPVVASCATPWSELQRRRCGLWVNNSPRSLANAISQLRHRNLAEMGSRGRAWMSDSFDWRSVAAQMAALYRRLVTAR